MFRDGSRTPVRSKVESFVITVNGWKLLSLLTIITINYYHKSLHLGCCSSPRSVSVVKKRLVSHDLDDLDVFDDENPESDGEQQVFEFVKAPSFATL